MAKFIKLTVSGHSPVNPNGPIWMNKGIVEHMGVHPTTGTVLVNTRGYSLCDVTETTDEILALIKGAA